MGDTQNLEPIDGEMVAMGIIASSGDARSFAFGALAEAKKGNYAEAERLLEECKKAGVQAHQSQMDLLTAQANGNAPQMDVLLVHAQDHFMTSMLAEELIRELIELHKKVDEK